MLNIKKAIDALYKIKKSKMPNDEKYKYLDAILNSDEFCDSLTNVKSWTENGLSYDDLDNLLDVMQPPKGERGFFIDIYGNRISYNGTKDLKREDTELWETKSHKIEYNKCKNDFKYFRFNYVKILTRKGIGRPELRKYQIRLEDSLLSGNDCLVFFSRQSGKSITIGTYLLWKILFHPYKIGIGIVANRAKTAKEVLDKIKKMYRGLPLWIQKGVTTWNKSDIELEGGYKIVTDAPSSDTFRSDTINILYIDEAAYIPKNKWDDMIDAIMPTMNSLEYTQLIYSSTANGINHWEELVRKARSGDSDYTLVENDWREVPHYTKDGKKLTPEEYRERVIKKHGLKYFLQTEENEFLGSSDTLVNGESLQRILSHLDEIEDQYIHTGYKGLKVIEKPIKGHLYIISVDAAKDGSDYFSFHIVDITKFPFRQIGTANLQIDYLEMPEYLNELGRYYNDAFIIIENNEGAGQSVADTLWKVYEYENIYRDKKNESFGYKRYPGFRTTSKSRDLILKLLKIFIEEEKLEINFKETLKELFTFTKQNGKFQAEPGYHDDNVMALAIAFAPFMYIEDFSDYEKFVKDIKRDLDLLENDEDDEYYLQSIGFSSDDEEERRGDIGVSSITDYEALIDEMTSPTDDEMDNLRWI